MYLPEGNAEQAARLLFTAGDYLYAISPEDGKPLKSFGEGGKIVVGEARASLGLFENILVIPLFVKDVIGVDVYTGEKLWRFNTIPEKGEYGAHTWLEVESGANCWGGIAVDEGRGDCLYCYRFA